MLYEVITPLALPVQAVRGGIDAVDAHHETLPGLDQQGEIAGAPGQRPHEHRPAGQPRFAAPVPPLGEGLVQLQADRVR